MFPIFVQSSMGPIKFSVTFLMGPPDYTSIQTTFAPKKKTYNSLHVFPMKLISLYSS
jgi:hypothetical protein